MPKTIWPEPFLSPMKSRLHVIALLAIGCAFTNASQAQTLPNGSAAFVDPDAAHVAEIRALGEHVIMQLGGTLLNEVTTAVTQSGPEKAIEVCHLKALPLTRETMSGQPRITEVKRTSQRLRNPANAPDAAEKLALRLPHKFVEHPSRGLRRHSATQMREADHRLEDYISFP